MRHADRIPRGQPRGGSESAGQTGRQRQALLLLAPLVIVALIAGVWSGLARLGLGVPLAGHLTTVNHAGVLVSGFIGTVIDRAVAAVDSVVEQVVIVRVPGQTLPPIHVRGSLTVVEDPIEGQGPLVGMTAGLAAAESPVSVVVGVDHPFLQPDLIRLLASRVSTTDRWVVPVADGRPQPLCPAFASDAASVLQAHVDRGDRAPMALVASLGMLVVTEEEWRIVDPDGLSFADVDTPADFEAARQRIERR